MPVFGCIGHVDFAAFVEIYKIVTSMYVFIILEHPGPGRGGRGRGRRPRAAPRGTRRGARPAPSSRRPVRASAWVERYGWQATVSFVSYSDQNSVKIPSKFRKFNQNSSEILIHAQSTLLPPGRAAPESSTLPGGK